MTLFARGEKVAPEYLPSTSTPIFSPDQLAAIEKFKKWHAGPNPEFFSLMGQAGCGKTTLAKYLADFVSGPVYFCAFTGKAALVMRQSGCPGAQTIHSLIYSPTERSKTRLKEIEAALASFPDDGPPEALVDLHQQLQIEQENMKRPMFKLRSDSELRYASLCIIDECSMIDEQIGKDLLSFGRPILALGDPGQLPPVRGEGYFTRAKPNHLLTEIHRQAKESPIIQMATTVRTGGRLQLGQYGNCSVIEKATEQIAMEADQIIVGRNKTRANINRRTREVLGYPKDEPVPGDKLVCLRNNHELGLLNGSLWELLEIEAGTETCWMRVRAYQEPEGQIIECVAHMHYFQRRADELDHWDKRDAEEFDFGYAITCHKSQGSQWGNVLVIDESECFGPNASKHLYTAITRAMHKVTVVL
jgi:exodeoxyribonuclease V